MPKNPRKFKIGKTALKPPKKMPEWAKPSEAEVNFGIAKLKWKKEAHQTQS